MVKLIIDAADIQKLSGSARKEILALFSMQDLSGKGKTEPASESLDEPVRLTSREMTLINNGVNTSAQNVLRCLAEHNGRVKYSKLCKITGSEAAFSRVESGITRRLRNVTGNRQAKLFLWEEETEVRDKDGYWIDGFSYVSSATKESLKALIKR